jgi:2',3'-cyclic-nucleotide 2'-phosphodiesterase/3'-nucleotidase
VICILACLAWRHLPAPPRPQAAPRVAITLLATTDIHGHIFPVSEETGKPAAWGLARIATLIAQERARHPNALLLDCGDTTQGTASAWYAATRQSKDPNPSIAAMNSLEYAAIAVGNHDFDFGMEHLGKIRHEARFPILAANVTASDRSMDHLLLPYMVRTIAGVRVGIVGFVTPGVLRWELPENYRGLRFHSIVDSARTVIPEVRAESDLVVVIAHSGLGRDPAADPSSLPGAPPDESNGENAMAQLAAQVPGIDVILFGHTHREVPEKFINGVLLAQPKFWAQSLAEVEVALERQPTGWRVTSKTSRTISVTDAVPPAPAILQSAAAIERATEVFLDQPVARLAQPLDGATARVEDHPLLDLIHAAQLDAAHADVSLATLFFTSVRFPAGTLTARQFFALYPYENTLLTVEMTGAQLKEILERSASYYPAWPPPTAGLAPLPGYQADTAAGVSYALDLSQPVGSRIRNLQFRGRPLDPSRTLLVAMNHYRYYGGGGYDTYRRTRIVRRAPQPVRDILIAYARRLGSIPVESTGAWRVEPAEAREALLRVARDRSQP